MTKRVMPVLLAAALFANPAAALALDRASAAADQGRVSGNLLMAPDPDAPKPIRKRLHHPARKPAADAAAKQKPDATLVSATAAN